MLAKLATSSGSLAIDCAIEPNSNANRYIDASASTKYAADLVPYPNVLSTSISITPHFTWRVVYLNVVHVLVQVVGYLNGQDS